MEQARQDKIRAWALSYAVPRLLDAAELGEHAAAMRANPDDYGVRVAARRAAWAKRDKVWGPYLGRDSEFAKTVAAKVKSAVEEKLAGKPAAGAAVAAEAAEAAGAAGAAVAAVAAVAAGAAGAAGAAEAAVAAGAAGAAWKKPGGWAYSDVYWAVRSAIYNKVRVAVRDALTRHFRDTGRPDFVTDLEESAQQLVRDLCAMTDAA